MARSLDEINQLLVDAEEILATLTARQAELRRQIHLRGQSRAASGFA